MFRRKQTLAVELGFQLFKGQLRRADAVREHVVDVDLKRTVPLVQRGTAAHHDLHPLFGAEAKPPRIRAEHDRLHAGRLVPPKWPRKNIPGRLVPQGKITVAASGILHEICDLAPQSKVKQDIVDIQKRLDILVER